MEIDEIEREEHCKAWSSGQVQWLRNRRGKTMKMNNRKQLKKYKKKQDSQSQRRCDHEDRGQNDVINGPRLRNRVASRILEEQL